MPRKFGTPQIIRAPHHRVSSQARWNVCALCIARRCGFVLCQWQLAASAARTCHRFRTACAIGQHECARQFTFSIRECPQVRARCLSHVQVVDCLGALSGRKDGVLVADPARVSSLSLLVELRPCHGLASKKRGPGTTVPALIIIRTCDDAALLSLKSF
jgi:hypothetical protein